MTQDQRVGDVEPQGYAVKVKLPDMKRWEFLGRGGRLVHLWVHALSFTQEGAEKCAAQIAEANKAETRIVPHRFGLLLPPPQRGTAPAAPSKPNQETP